MKTLILLLVVSSNAMAYDKYCGEHVAYANFHAKINNKKEVNALETCQLISALIKQESGSNPYAFNPEKTGSYGLLQIQCATAKRLGLKEKCEVLYNPHINLHYGIKLISHLKSRYKNTKDIIAAYNAGRVIVRKGDYINSEYVDQVYMKLIEVRRVVLSTTNSTQD